MLRTAQVCNKTYALGTSACIEREDRTDLAKDDVVGGRRADVALDNLKNNGTSEYTLGEVVDAVGSRLGRR